MTKMRRAILVLFVNSFLSCAVSDYGAEAIY